MWKVVITEIQDAGTLEPTRVPPGAFFVSTERFSRTVGDLDLQALIKTIDRMQAPQGCRSEDPVSGENILRRAGSLRSEGLRGAHGASLEPARSKFIAPPFFSQTDP
jgi:hypothetical protein